MKCLISDGSTTDKKITTINISLLATTKNSPTMKFEDVPNDIFTSVYEFLDVKELVHCVSLVNKQWRNTTMQTSVWRTRTILLNEQVEEISESMIQFFTQCDITKFFLHNYGQVNQLIPQVHNVVTELMFEESVEIDSIDIGIVPMFPVLNKFCYVQEEWTNIFKWISQMPNLTILRTPFGDIDDINFQIILSLKKLKELRLYYNLSEEQTIELFKQLPLLENVDIMLKDNINSSMWNTVFQIDGVSDRLKHLAVTQGEFEKNVNTSYQLQRINIEELKITRSAMSHMVLLYCGQQSIKRLDIDAYDVSLNNLKLPNLSHLTISNAKYSDVLSILTSCSNTVESIELDSLVRSKYTPLKFTLAKIHTLALNGAGSDFYTDLIGNVNGSSIRVLAITCNVTNSLVDAFEGIASRITNLRAATIPQVLFRFIPQIRNLDYIFITAPLTDLDEHTLNIIKSDRLTSIVMESLVNKATADNWLFRLLNHCQILERMSIRTETTSFVNISEMRLHKSLTHIDIDYSSIRENLGTLLKNTPNLKNFSLNNIPLDQYSSVLESIDKYPVGTIHLSIHPTTECSTSFNQCHYLDNEKVKEIIVTVSTLSDTIFTFEQYLLVALCSFNKSKQPALYFTTTVNKQIFLGDDYQEYSIDFESHLLSIIHNKLIKKVVPMITGISDEKRNTLLQITTTNSQLVRDICSLITRTFDWL
jgi:hypothetical protein